MRAGFGERRGGGSPMPRPAPVTSARRPSSRKEAVGVRLMIIGHG